MRGWVLWLLLGGFLLTMGVIQFIPIDETDDPAGTTEAPQSSESADET